MLYFKTHDVSDFRQCRYDKSLQIALLPTAERTINNTLTATKIITSEMATAVSMSPVLNCRKMLTGKTSVFCSMAPANIKTGPNSPKARAQARVPAVNNPVRAEGNTTAQNACDRLHPSVMATCSWRGERSSNVDRIVRVANAVTTVN